MSTYLCMGCFDDFTKPIYTESTCKWDCEICCMDYYGMKDLMYTCECDQEPDGLSDCSICNAYILMIVKILINIKRQKENIYGAHMKIVWNLLSNIGICLI